MRIMVSISLARDCDVTDADTISHMLALKSNYTKLYKIHLTQFESDLGHNTMIEIFELYLCGCNKVIQYLHD